MSSFGLLTLHGEDRDHGRRGPDHSGGERPFQPPPSPRDSLEQWRQVLAPLTSVTDAKKLTDVTAHIAIPVTMKVLFLAARTLRSGHCLLNLSPGAGKGEGKLENDESPPPSLCMALAVVLPWMRHIIPLLYQITPSQGHILDANRLVQFLGLARSLDNSQRTSSPLPALVSGIGQGSSSEDLDAIPLAYDTRRDSRTRHSDRQPHLHANQQRTRDQLHAWLRGVPRWRPAQAASAGFELMAGVHDENLGWFAELLLNEYEQLERHQTQRASRLERLEVRLTNAGAQGGASLGENPIILLVRMVDSLRLTVVLQSLLFSLIEDELLGSVEQDGGEGASTSAGASTTVNISAGPGTNPSPSPGLHTESTVNRIIDVSSLIERLVSLGRLLAACAPPVLGQYDDPVLCFMRDLLIERTNARHQLLMTLPLAGSLLRAGPPSLALGLRPILCLIKQGALRPSPAKMMGEQRRHPNPKANEGGEGGDVCTVMLRLLLDALLGDEGCNEDDGTNDVGATDHKEGVGGSNTLDLSSRSSPFPHAQDELLRYELILSPNGLEFVLGRLVSDFKQWQGELALCCNGMGAGLSLSATDASVTASLPNSNAGGSTVMGTAPSSRPPRKVRPVTAAPEAAQVQRRLRQWFWWQWPTFRSIGLALIRYLQGEGYSQAAAARLLWALLPPLLPEALREAPTPMLRLVISLLLEEYIEGDDEREGKAEAKAGAEAVVRAKEDNVNE